MRNKRIFGFSIVLFTLFLLYSTINIVGIENPDKTITIDIDDSYTQEIYSVKNQILNFEAEVIQSGDLEVNVFLVDSENFNKFLFGVLFSPLREYRGVSYISFSYRFTNMDDHYIIINNPATSASSKTVEIKYSVDQASFFQIIPGYPILIIITLTSIDIIGIVIIILRKKT